MASPIRYMVLLILCFPALASCTIAEPKATAAPAPAVVTVNGPASPAKAHGLSLYLARYEIQPNTSLRPHHHEGTQIGLVASGELTYHVLTGDVPVYRTGADGKPVLDRTLTAGSVGTVQAGEWLVEEPEDHHWGANEGEIPSVIYTSSLLREAPRSPRPIHHDGRRHLQWATATSATPAAVSAARCATRPTARHYMPGYCFCGDCRKASGSGFIPFMGFPRSALRVTGEAR